MRLEASFLPGQWEHLPWSDDKEQDEPGDPP
jgi:hypothetical protein